MVQLKIKIWTKRKIKRFRESIDKKVIFEWGVIAVLLFIAYFMFNYLLMPQINLNGGKHIVINYKDNYSDMGYSAKYLGKDVTSDVSPIHWQYGAIARLPKHAPIYPLLQDGYATITLGLTNRVK